MTRTYHRHPQEPPEGPSHITKKPAKFERDPLCQDGNVRFCWSEWQKGWILGSFFYGYIVMQVFGGSLAERFGTKIVLGTANALTAIMSLFIPVVSRLDWRALMALRVLQVSH